MRAIFDLRAIFTLGAAPNFLLKVDFPEMNKMYNKSHVPLFIYIFLANN